MTSTSLKIKTTPTTNTPSNTPPSPNPQCEIEKLEPDNLTVGSRFWLHCRGVEGYSFSPKSHPELRLEKSDEYKLVLLDIRSINSSQIDLLVTSYKVGTHNLKLVQLVDQNQSLILGDITFQVNSVLEIGTNQSHDSSQNAPSIQKEPYGPMGPIILPPPPWVLITIASLAIILVLTLILHGFRLRSRHRRRKEVETQWRIWSRDVLGVREKTFSQGAYDVFHYHWRRLHRQLEHPIPLDEEQRAHLLKELEEIYHFYLACVFYPNQSTPLINRVNRRTGKTSFKGKKAKYKGRGKTRNNMGKNLEVASEFERLRSQENWKQDLTLKDLDQFFALARKSVETIESHRSNPKSQEPSKGGPKK